MKKRKAVPAPEPVKAPAKGSAKAKAAPVAKPSAKPAVKAAAKKGAAKPKPAKNKRASMRGQAQKMAAKQLAKGDSGKVGQGANCKFKPEYAQRLVKFFQKDAHKVQTDFKTGLTTHVFDSWPTFQRFAAEIGVTTDTLHLWATEIDPDTKELRRPEFSASYARAREVQQDLLMQGGMSGAYQSGFATLAAKNILGWKDKVESDNTHVIREVDTAALDAIYNQRLAESAAMNQTRGH